MPAQKLPLPSVGEACPELGRRGRGEGAIQTMTTPPHGCGSSAACVCDRIASGEGGYVTFCNVHLTVTARKDTRLRDIINNSFMSMPAARFVFHQTGGLPARNALSF